MPNYIVLANFTEQGIRNVKQTTQRAEALKAEAEKLGVKVKDFFWTLGSCDVVTVFEAPDDETITRLMLQVGSLGNVRTQTLRAFTREEMDGILAKLP